MSNNFLKKTAMLSLAATLFEICSIGMAQNVIRPGLWETNTTSDLLKLVPSIPPDQMQNLMNLAQEHGIDMPRIQNGAASARICITLEMAAKRIVSGLFQNQLGCSVSHAAQDGSRYSIDYSCANADLTGNGKAAGSFSSPEKFSGRTTFDGVVRGNPIVQQAGSTGKWLSASCGAVRPFQ